MSDDQRKSWVPDPFGTFWFVLVIVVIGAPVAFLNWWLVW